jgi:hypothetical protein
MLLRSDREKRVVGPDRRVGDPTFRAEIDRVLADATPHGLIRHSSLAAPTLRFPWERMLDVEPLEVRGGDCPTAIYDPEAIRALIYTSGTTGAASDRIDVAHRAARATPFSRQATQGVVGRNDPGVGGVLSTLHSVAACFAAQHAVVATSFRV